MDDLQSGFLSEGSILIRGGIPPALLERLRAALEPVLDSRGRGTSSSTRHQTLLEPRMYQPAYKDFLNLPGLNHAAAAIAGSSDLLAMGMAVLIGSPERLVCKWHRDGGDDHDEVAGLLEHGRPCIQTNCALYDDESLWIVPGSHRSPTPAAQRAHVLRHARTPSPNGPSAPEELSGMPGAVNVRLAAGDCLLYNPFLWHAAEYRPEWKRATLHSAWWPWTAVERFRTCRLMLGSCVFMLGSDHLGGEGPFLAPQLARYREAVRRWVRQPAQASAAGR